MYIGLNNLGLNSRSSAFSPSNLFASGEQGFFFINDLSTMYQDSAGTTPAALEQPLGLWLDSRYGAARGAELIPALVAANFTPSGAGASVTNPVAGQLTVTNGGAAEASANVPIYNATANLSYEVTATCAGLTGTGAAFVVVGNANMSLNGVGTFRRIVTPTAGGPVRLAVGTTTAGHAVSVTAMSVRELPGNHATQPTGANRPTVSARYNVLTKTEAFSDATWSKAVSGTGVSSTVTDAYAAAPDGTTTASRILLDRGAGTTSSDFARVFQSLSAGASLASGIWLKSNTGASQSVEIGFGAGTSAAVTATTSWQYFPLTNATGTPTNYAVLARGTTTAQTVDVLAWHPDVRQTVHAIPGIPAYQRVNTATDYDSAGFPVRVKFNGTNQWMVTASVDLSGTSQLTLIAGVQANGAARGIVMHNGGSVPAPGIAGGFSLEAPAFSNNQYGATIPAAANNYDVLSAVATFPDSGKVLTAKLDTSQANAAASAALRVNTVQTVSASPGAPLNQPFANAAVTLGMRANQTTFFNGDIYALAVRGATTAAATISQTETYVNTRMGKVY